MLVAAANLITRRGGVCAFQAAASASRLIHTSGLLIPKSMAASRPFNSKNNRIISYPSLITTRLNEQTSDNDNGNEVEPTWNYVPYQPPPQRRKPRNQPRRNFSSSPREWTVPDHIPIPEDQLQITFSRASGAGGQNVNKVNTKVDLRFHVDTAHWIPHEVRQRLKSNESNRISSEGYMTFSCQEHRTQLNNRKESIKKLQDIIKNSWARPKVRKLRKGLTKQAKVNRRENKKKQSKKKDSRKRVVDF